MKLTLEHYDTVCTIETKYDDLVIDEVIEKIKSLLIAAGFHPKTVENAMGFEESIISKYNELLNAVVCEYPGETKHETVVSYIRESEKNIRRPSWDGVDD